MRIFIILAISFALLGISFGVKGTPDQIRDDLTSILFEYYGNDSRINSNVATERDFRFFEAVFGKGAIEKLRLGLKLWMLPLLSPKTPSVYMDYIACDTCLMGIPLIKGLLDLGQLPLIVSILVSVCQGVDILTPEHCAPLIASFQNPVVYILQNTDGMTADDICGILDDGCSQVNPIYSQFDVLINGNKPPLVDAPPIPTDAPSVKVLQFTDLHMDLHYKEESNAECGNPAGCCWDGTPADPEASAGQWGHENCQLPLIGLDEIFSHASTAHSDAKYIFLTGDYIHSALWAYSPEENGEHLREVIQSVQEHFPSTPMYPVVGNHEADVCNLYPPTHLWGDGFDLSWLYNIFADSFATIPEDQVILFKKYGYYSVSPEPGLRLLMLNSNLCYIQNFWIVYYPGDVFFQLDWLSQELAKAETAGEMVHIVGHVSPGHNQCWPPWSHNFNRIVNRYENIIKAQYYGHSHNSEFLVAFEPETDRVTSVSYVGPSGMPDNGRYAYAVYSLDGGRGGESTWEVIDSEVWGMDIGPANENGTPAWTKAFSIKELYSMSSLRPSDFGALIDRMVADNSVLNDYQWQRDKGAKERGFCSEEDVQCRGDVICRMVGADQSDHSHCQRYRDALEQGQSAL